MSFRIVQAVGEFSAAGGAETVAFELQRRWHGDGTDSSVLAGSIGADIPAALRSRVRPVLPRALQRIPTRGAWRHVGRAMAVPAFSLSVSAALRRHSEAVVLSHGDALIADVVVLHAVNAASLAQKRADGEWRWALNPMHSWVAARDRMMLRGLRSRRYVAVSRRVVDELHRFHGVPRERTVVIGNGTDIERFRPDGPPAGLRARFGIGHAPLLLFVGHEFDRKGLLHLLGALARPGCGAAHAVVVGAGEIGRYRAAAAALGVGARVHFAGAQRDLPAFYREADAFVFPTAYETFSLVCMEAMASGVPIFAPRVGGIEDYLREGVNGCFIERDAGSVAAALAPVLADRALRNRLGAGARATSCDYGWDRVADRYRALLRQVWQEKMSCKLS